MTQDLLHLSLQVTRAYGANESLKDALQRFVLWWHSAERSKSQLYERLRTEDGIAFNDRPARDRFLTATEDLHSLLQSRKHILLTNAGLL